MMKIIKQAILIMFTAMIIISCKQKLKSPKDHVIFSGKISNYNGGLITLKRIPTDENKNYIKKIKVVADGTFSDTLHVNMRGLNYYLLACEKYRFNIYLKNGYNIKMVGNYETKLDQTVEFSGIGAENNNYLIKKTQILNLIYNDIETIDKASFEKKIKKMKAKLFKELESNDAEFAEDEKLQIESEISFASMMLDAMIESKKDLIEKQAAAKVREEAKKKKLDALIGKPSPEFKNYENYKGGTTSLDEFKGKYVYIDVWATWCDPCRSEIPFLGKLEKKYHGKNIVFISISVDKKKTHEKWKDMIKNKKMGGVQLFAEKNFKSDFIKAYYIESIPRFILIDPKGKIIDADAKRPSSPELEKQFKKLGI